MGNKALARLSENIVDLIDAYIEVGNISRAELIGMIEMLKLGYFQEFMSEEPDEEDDYSEFD